MIWQPYNARDWSYAFDGDAAEVSKRIASTYREEIETVPMNISRETPKLSDMTLSALAAERQHVTTSIQAAAHDLAVAQENYSAAVNRLHHVDAESSRRKLAASGIVLRPELREAFDAEMAQPETRAALDYLRDH